MKVLVAEDDIDLSDVTAFALRRQGFTVVRSYSGAQAIEHFESENPDVIVLDIGLPEPDGFEVLRHIRTHSDVPIVVLTARTDEQAMVQAFGAGADDYLTKPFSFRQLTLRLQAVTRRARSQKVASQLEVGRLTIDRDTWSVYAGTEPLKLTRLEFKILYCLASHFCRVTPTDRLLRFVWRDDGGDGNVLKTHVSHIRHKLSRMDSGLAINAIPNVGYMLTQVDAQSALALAGSNAS